MARILIVEDEKDMLEGLKDNFEFDLYDVLTADNGEDGLQIALNQRVDLIILDLMLPKKSGFDVCKELREKKIQVPVIMLTARGEEIDKVLGLELGADDYMTKPFSVRELLARVKAVLRRTALQKSGESQYCRMGRLELDFDHFLAKDEKGTVELTHKEFEILALFLKNKGQTVSREKLLNNVWGYDNFPTSRTVDNFILKLRKKLEEDPEHPAHILTVHGIGYKYID